MSLVSRCDQVAKVENAPRTLALTDLVGEIWTPGYSTWATVLPSLCWPFQVMSRPPRVGASASVVMHGLSFPGWRHLGTIYLIAGVAVRGQSACEWIRLT